MKILVTGNPNFGLAESISKIYTDAKFVTKSAGFDLTSPIKQDELSDIALDYDVFVVCAYIPNYVPNILLQKVYDNCKNNNDTTTTTTTTTTNHHDYYNQDHCQHYCHCQRNYGY